MREQPRERGLGDDRLVGAIRQVAVSAIDVAKRRRLDNQQIDAGHAASRSRPRLSPALPVAPKIVPVVPIAPVVPEAVIAKIPLARTPGIYPAPIRNSATHHPRRAAHRRVSRPRRAEWPRGLADCGQTLAYARFHDARTLAGGSRLRPEASPDPSARHPARAERPDESFHICDAATFGFPPAARLAPALDRVTIRGGSSNPNAQPRRATAAVLRTTPSRT